MGKTTARPEPETEPELNDELHEDDAGGELHEDDYDDGDDFEDEPEEVRPVDVKVKASTTPEYLQSFLALKGVPHDILEGLDVRKAWLQVETRKMPARAMPLGHLAPDALQTFDELGYERHARFEIRPYYNAPDVRYFAAILPDLSDLEEDDEEEDGRGGGAIVAAMLDAQNKRMDRFESLMLKMAEGQADPFKQIERALSFAERIHESVAQVRGNDGDADLLKTLIEQFGPKLLEGIGKSE